VNTALDINNIQYCYNYSNKSNMFYELPIDLQNYIFEFNATHRYKYNKSLEKIPRTGIHIRYMRILDEFDEQIHENGDWNFEKLLKKHIVDPEHFLNVLKSCKCCVRHTGCAAASACADEPCLCYCRHLSRFIDKIYNTGEVVRFGHNWNDRELFELN